MADIVKILLGPSRRTAIVFMCSFAFHSVGISSEPIQPIPVDVKVDAKKAALGEMLFNDKRLSKDGSMSCASCHAVDKGGADGRKFSVGIGGAISGINAPTVFNSSLNFRQFWDGRADSLESQVDGPVHNPKEMGTSWKEVMEKLKSDKNLNKLFLEIFKDGIQPDNIKNSIAEYERSLVTPNARFDKYLRGDANAITAEELRGYQLFKKYGCVACHQGMNAGGNMFQVFGALGDYFSKRGNLTEADLGRFNVTKNPADKHVFKVPSLRNIALTAPYFHDGSAESLEAAVDVMFKYQLGRTAPPQDKAEIIKFLKTLTGEHKGKPL